MKVVHCKKEPYDVYIGRPSKWGNPFLIGRDGTREEVVAKYREWIVTQEDLLKDIGELHNKVLGCWCSPESCHGDVLLELVEDWYNRTECWDIPGGGFAIASRRMIAETGGFLI